VDIYCRRKPLLNMTKYCWMLHALGWESFPRYLSSSSTSPTFHPSSFHLNQSESGATSYCIIKLLFLMFLRGRTYVGIDSWKIWKSWCVYKTSFLIRHQCEIPCSVKSFKKICLNNIWGYLQGFYLQLGKAWWYTNLQYVFNWPWRKWKEDCCFCSEASGTFFITISTNFLVQVTNSIFNLNGKIIYLSFLFGTVGIILLLYVALFFHSSSSSTINKLLNSFYPFKILAGNWKFFITNHSHYILALLFQV